MTVRVQRVSSARRVIRSPRLLRLAFVVWRTVREWTPLLSYRNAKLRRQFEPWIPVPPGALIFSATGTRSVDWFLVSGEATAGALTKALESVGRPLDSFERVFELGCGCGRILRQWSRVDGPEWYASDYNPQGVEWGKKHLPYVNFSLNQLGPPLEFTSEFFDLCYAVSVFTHLPEDLQEPWVKEMHRVLRPGGILLVTLSGEGDLVRTTMDEQSRFHSQGIVVVDPNFAGTNLCGVYHSEAFVRRTWAPYFRVLKFFPQGASGSPKQDLYVLERL